jgi:predicted PurR-regulated permease PerM
MTAPSATAVLGVGSVVLLIAVGLPLWKPLLIAAVLAGSLSHANERLVRKVGERRSLAAALLSVGVVLVVLVPLSLVGLLVAKQALSLIAFVRHTVEQKGVPGLLAPLPAWLARFADEALARWSREPHDVLSEMGKWSRTGWALGVAAGLVGSFTHLLLMIGLMLVALFFLLRDGPALIVWADRTSAMPEGQLESVLSELRGVSRSVIGAHLATGLIQAAVATIGYTVSGVPSALLFGVLTLAASFIPSVGAAVVGLPLAGLLWIMGRHGWAIFLAAWTTLVTGLVDNVARPLLVRGGTDLHGALVFFALLGGILTFGPMGIIVGPLALALFLTMSTIHRRERTSMRVT